MFNVSLLCSYHWLVWMLSALSFLTAGVMTTLLSTSLSNCMEGVKNMDVLILRYFEERFSDYKWMVWDVSMLL